MRNESILVRFKTKYYKKIYEILEKNKNDDELNTIHKLIKFIVEDYFDSFEDVEKTKRGTTK
jgi:hypothetical protein